MKNQPHKNISIQNRLTHLTCLVCNSEIKKINEYLIKCTQCGKEYKIKNGIPVMLSDENMVIGSNRIFQKIYNIITYIYNSNSNTPRKIFAFLDGKHIKRYFPKGEDAARKEIFARLEFKENDKVLETGVGRGENIPYISDVNKKVYFYGMDISYGMLRLCRETMKQFKILWDLLLANAEDLPYKDNYFDVVFHVGGINFFTNKKKAIEEMVRVAKPNTRILISDETSKIFASRGLVRKTIERIILGNDLSKKVMKFKETEILDYLPKNIEDVKFDIIWEGNGYCLEFRKKEAK